jgi:hypothetical protein
MKIEKLIVTLSVGLLSALSVGAQGTFQNLNFEQANPNPDTPGPVTAASAVPYWTVYYDNVQQTEVMYNDESLGGTQLTLVSAHDPYGPSAIDGNYSVFLQSYAGDTVVSISQTGLIPAGTQSLLFEAQGSILGALGVLVGNQTVPLSVVGSGPNYTLYGANISAWADDTEQLTFSVFGQGNPNDAWELDDISFSTTALTPEPNTVALTAIGGLLFGARKWFARR